jgi:hypothetical protein
LVSRSHAHVDLQRCLPSELVADHLDIDLLAHAVPQAADEVLVNPWLELAHPNDSCQRTGLKTNFTTVSLPESGLVVWRLAAVARDANLHVVELSLRIHLLWDLSLRAVALSATWRTAILRALLAVEVGVVGLLEAHCASDG